MTQYLGSSNGGGGGGGGDNSSCAPFSPSASTPSRQRPWATRGDRGKDGRNQCITDFFKPTINPDRTVLCSPEKGNGKIGLPVASSEHLRKSISSPKRIRRKKLPIPPSNRSPIIDAFFRGIKSEKKDSPDNGVHISVKATYPNIVVRKLFIPADSSDCSLILKDNACMNTPERNEKCPIQTETSLGEIRRECQIDLVDSDSAVSDLSKWTSVSENDSLGKESAATWCQKTMCSETLQSSLVSSSSQSSLETVCRKIQKKKKKMQCKQQTSGSVKKSLSTNLPNQETGGLLIKKSCLTSWDFSSDELPADQSAEAALSSRWRSDETVNRKKGCSCPSVHSDSTAASKHKRCPGKRKRNSLETSVKNSQTPLAQRNNTEQFTSLLRDSDSVLASEQSDDVTIPSSSCDLSKMNDSSSPKMCILNKVRSLSFGEDKISGDSLDSSDEEGLLPLEKILAQSLKPPPKSPERINDDEDTTNSHNGPLSKPFETQFSYMNHLEHLLKEKEEFKRVDELEQQLLKIKQAIEINSVPEEDDDEEEEKEEEEESYDGELSAEHRAFIEKFSVIGDAIPDQHPGENIFQISQAGKIFNHHNLDLRNSGLNPQNPIEKYILGCGITQQLFVISEGLLMSAYHNSPCPVPILKWMFKMMSIHPDSSVSRKILNMLMTLTIETASAGDSEPKPWIPSMFDMATVLINMGAPFSSLFPLQHFQPAFTEDDIMREVHVKQQSSGDITGNAASFFLQINASLCNMAKFLRLCISINPGGYTEKEILLLLLMLLKLSLETQLKQFPLVDLQCLVIKLLENIRDWDTKMSELCLAICCLSSHHHDLLWLVHFVPNWISRGRQLRKQLSLVIISKLLNNDMNIPSNHDEQMSLLCEDLAKMKPSNLLKSLSETLEQNNNLCKESSLSELEPQKWLLKLCSTLEKHVKCDIREDARLFYRTKVKDLVARTYSKWQQMIHSFRLTQGKIHDFWDPDC
ncbi:hypothetical protein JRQ81_018161 [Phrynocephalus forsythii]|uniref:Coiled-coil SMC6 And NSE5 INteracting (CANIN) domain-containing protein n=1 Tax=Phrynocephalus forsythii TaxID=171643 RepID=A0A9Q0XRP2_9SAUR|nr:hypothetical protein JRQ81_018161 [Phrynocephalus forsythii]